MARQQAATAAALPALNAKRRRRVRLGSTAVLLTLIAFIGFANLYIHRVFQLQQQRMAQQQANTNAKQQQSNNWKPPSTDRFAATSTKEKENAAKDDPAKLSPGAALPVDADWLVWTALRTVAQTMRRRPKWCSGRILKATASIRAPS